jgi:hypothetical protein
MKRALIAAIVAATLIATPAHAEGKGPCRIAVHHRTYVHDVRHLIWCSVHFYGGVPGGVRYADYIAERESGYWPFAVSPTGCMGIYQWAPSTWAHLVSAWPVMNRWLGTDPYNARSNVLRAIRTAHETGWSPWGG